LVLKFVHLAAAERDCAELPDRRGHLTITPHGGE
jgi:hypothetical protein